MLGKSHAHELFGMAWDIPLTEFDADTAALIDPEAGSTSGGIPEHAVICFFRDVIDEVCGDGRADVVATFTWEHGIHQLFSLQVGDRRVAVFHPGVGAPLAGGLFEQVIATGCRTFVACGGAGAVVPGLALGHVIVPAAAVRDEGTSYHYLPPSREVAPTRLRGRALRRARRTRVPYASARPGPPTRPTARPERRWRAASRRVHHGRDGDGGLPRGRRHRGVTFGQSSTPATTSAARRGTTATGRRPRLAATCSGCRSKPSLRLP